MTGLDEAAARLRRRQFDRLAELQSRDRREADREAFVGTVGGRALPANPAPPAEPVKAQPVERLRGATVVHKVRLVATAGQHLSSAGGPWRFESLAAAPNSPVGFTTSQDAGFPASSWVADISGAVEFVVSWRWGFVDSGQPDLGRFRTAGVLELTRSRAGVAATESKSVPYVGTKWDAVSVTFDCLVGDVFTFATPHGSGSDETLASGLVDVRIIETVVSATEGPLAFASIRNLGTELVRADYFFDGPTQTWALLSPSDDIPLGVEVLADSVWYHHGSGAVQTWRQQDRATGSQIDTFTTTFTDGSNTYAGVAFHDGDLWVLKPGDDVLVVQIDASDGSIIDEHEQVDARTTLGGLGGLCSDGSVMWFVKSIYPGSFPQETTHELVSVTSAGSFSSPTTLEKPRAGTWNVNSLGRTASGNFLALWEGFDFPAGIEQYVYEHDPSGNAVQLVDGPYAASFLINVDGL